MLPKLNTAVNVEAPSCRHSGTPREQPIMKSSPPARPQASRAMNWTDLSRITGLDFIFTASGQNLPPSITPTVAAPCQASTRLGTTTLLSISTLKRVSWASRNRRGRAHLLELQPTLLHKSSSPPYLLRFPRPLQQVQGEPMVLPDLSIFLQALPSIPPPWTLAHHRSGGCRCCLR